MALAIIQIQPSPLSAEKESTTPREPEPGPDFPAILELLTQYFRFGYFLRLLPHKIEAAPDGSVGDGHRHAFLIRTNVSHKIATAVSHFLSLFAFLTFSRKVGVVYAADSHLNALIDAPVTYLYKGAYIWLVWRSSEDFLGLFQEIGARNPRRGGGRAAQAKAKAAGAGLCALFLFLPIVCVLGGHRLRQTQEWTPANFVSSNAAFTRFMLYLNPVEEAEDGGDGGFDSLKPWPDYVLAVVQPPIQFCNQLMSFYMDLCVQMIAFTYAWLCVEFAGKLERADVRGIDGVDKQRFMKGYADLLAITDHINGFCGFIFGAWLVEGFYTTIFVSRVLMNGFLDQLRHAFFVSIMFSIVLVTAWATHRLERAVSNWIRARSEELSSAQLSTLLNDLNNHRISLSALGVVPITFGFLGTALSVIITYAVVVYQLK